MYVHTIRIRTIRQHIFDLTRSTNGVQRTAYVRETKEGIDVDAPCSHATIALANDTISRQSTI